MNYSQIPNMNEESVQRYEQLMTYEMVHKRGTMTVDSMEQGVKLAMSIVSIAPDYSVNIFSTKYGIRSYMIIDYINNNYKAKLIEHTSRKSKLLVTSEFPGQPGIIHCFDDESKVNFNYHVKHGEIMIVIH